MNCLMLLPLATIVYSFQSSSLKALRNCSGVQVWPVTVFLPFSQTAFSPTRQMRPRLPPSS